MARENEMSFLEHARELRLRLGIGILLTLGAFLLALWRGTDLLAWIQVPLDSAGLKLHLFRAEEAFSALVKMSLSAALTVSLPVWLVLGGGFVLPALEGLSRPLALAFALVSLGLATGGFLFSALVLVPLSLGFLLGLGAGIFPPILGLESYVDFWLVLYWASALGFQLPLVMALLSRLGVAGTTVFRKARPAAVLVLFFVAAVITPPDVVSQILLGIPLVLLYEFGILLSRFAGRRSHGQPGSG